MSAEATAATAADAALAPTPALPGNEAASLFRGDRPSDIHNDQPHDDPANPKVAHGCADCTAPQQSPKPIGLHSPPDSNSAMKLNGSDDSDSELSDVEDPTLEPDQLPFLHAQSPEAAAATVEPAPEDEDIGEVTPDHWSGTVPVFKPNMFQFKDFKKFMEKIDSYGMKSGIVKIIPPQEWKEQLPALDDLVKQIRVREPIKQEIMGSNGTYRQVNILHQRSYNLPQWRQLCDQSEHQPPARRGERRAQAPTKQKAAPVPVSSSLRRRGTGASASTGGRATRSRTKRAGTQNAMDTDERPMTPVSPRVAEAVVDSVEQDIGDEIDDDEPMPSVMGRMGGMRQARPKEQSTSARRKYARREGSAMIDEEAFKQFDYKMDISDYTPERCEELERIYWKTLTFAPPLYGADVLGTLFDDNTESWNLNKLPNLLDVLGTKVPGVNTAYLYLGMWKATFAWHLEDVDLYSINYLHFGAPKQWYSISQGDARRFEAAMKSIWPTDAKACGQFLRHKAFLISPNHLQQHFNIKVNKCISYPGEFVVTYPYGYHSGYNLGYNCAEAVNFALDSWLPMGKIAKKCECAQAQDSVWVDVYEIERKLRGEETDYEETEDEEDEEEDDDDDEPEVGIPTPRSTRAVKLKPAGRKRKRAVNDKGEKKVKKIRLRIKSQVEPPCCLCPHDIAGFELLPTDDGRKAHRLCAQYETETCIEVIDEKEVVTNIAQIDQARLDLKCLFCRSKRGACFQCSHKKCVRAYHATCAAAAGVFVEEAEVPIFSEDGTEYKEQAFDFSCRFHRAKRDRRLDGDALDDCHKTRRAASALTKGDICQLQYHRGEIFAGIIIENRDSEQTFLVDVLPNGDRMEVEWKWLLLPDPSDMHLPRASQNAIPMPTSRKAKDLINANRKQIEELPRPDEPFVEGGFVWAEFNHHAVEINKAQTKVDLSKENRIWYYLGKRSTDARPQYTEDLRKKQHNCKSNFLDTIPRPAPPPPLSRKPYGSTFSIHTPVPVPKTDKPYQYKPRDPVPPTYIRAPFTAHQFVPAPTYTAQQFEPKSSGPTFIHHVQPTTRPTPSQPTPLPSALPYYKFQHSPYIPPGQQTQRMHHNSPMPRQQPKQASRKAQSHSSHEQNQSSQQTQHAQQAQQAVPQPAPYFNTQSGSQPHQSQLSAPGPTVTPPQVETPIAYTPNVLGKPQPVSRRPSLSRPTPPQSTKGHTRNKSSISSHSGRFALGTGQRFGTPPSSYGHARGDSTAKSPFSHGFTQPPGLGPSPSPQNNQFFQTQARARSSSLVSNISLNTPMTSSAIRPSSSTSAQALAGQLQSVISANTCKEPRPNVIQKYAFFQVHHNRDSTKYRTPYAPWGGFTNGYEGNLRAHLMRTPDALFGVRRQSVGQNGVNAGAPPMPHMPATGAFLSTGPSTDVPLLGPPPVTPHTLNTPLALAHSTAMHLDTPSKIQPASHSAPQSSAAKDGSTWRSSSAGGPNTWDANASAAAALHPAIRAQYAAMLQNGNVKVENQADSGSVNHPLAVVPPLPESSLVSVSGAPSTPSTQESGLSSPYCSQMGSGHGARPKSTTPIPLPTVPVASSISQNTVVSAGPVKAVPKRTHVPAPRPWETLRKVQTTSRPNVPQSSPPVHTMTTPSPAPMTPNTQTPPTYSHPGESYRHPPSSGFDSNHVVQSANSWATPVQQIRSAVAQPPLDSAAQRLSPTGTTDLYAPSAVASGQPQPAILPTVNHAVPSSGHGGGMPELPEVSDGSMELVESIIRNAQMASESFLEHDWET